MVMFRELNRRTQIEQALSGTVNDGRRWKEKTSNQMCEQKSSAVEAAEAGLKLSKFIMSDKVGKAEPWLLVNVGGHGSSDTSIPATSDADLCNIE